MDADFPLTTLQTAKAALQAEVQSLRGRVDKEQDQMWAGVDGDQQEAWGSAGDLAADAPALPLRNDGGAEGQVDGGKDWGVQQGFAGQDGRERAGSAGKVTVSEQRLREELARKNEEILELRIRVGTMEGEIRSSREFVQMRAEMEISQVRQEAEWQRQMGMQEMARNRHDMEMANAKKERLKGALEGAVVEMRERRRDVEALKGKLATLSSKFEASAQHLLSEESLLKNLQSVKQGIDSLNKEASAQIQSIDASYESFMKAARWSGEAEGDTDDLSAMPRGPQGPAAPKGKPGAPGAGKADKGGPSPGKRGAADGKAPSPGKKGVAGAADAAGAAGEHQGGDGRAQQAPSLMGAYGGGYPVAGSFAANPYAGGYMAAGPRPPLAPMAGAAFPPSYMGAQGGGPHMQMFNGGLQGMVGAGAAEAGGGAERRLPDAYPLPGRFYSDAQGIQGVQGPLQPNMQLMPGYHGGGAARHGVPPSFGGVAYAGGGGRGGGYGGYGAGGAFGGYQGGGMAAYGGGGVDMPGGGGAVVGADAYEQDVMQYMDDDWWRQPKGEGEQGSGGGGEGVVGG